MWIDKRHNWHMLYEGGCNGDVGHSWSEDGVSWSNITCAWNMSRPGANAAPCTAPHRALTAQVAEASPCAALPPGDRRALLTRAQS
jgi:hypothetical protein